VEEEEKNVKKEQITGWLSLSLAFLRSICRPIVRALSFSVFSFFHLSCSFANYIEQLFKLEREMKEEKGRRRRRRRRGTSVCMCARVR
jgi:hypothetical protein